MYFPDILALPRRVKRALFLSMDVILVPAALYAAFVLRYGTLTPLGRIQEALPLFALMTVIGAAIIWVGRLPLIKLHSFETRAIIKIGLVATMMVLLAITLSYFLGLSGPRSVPLIFGMLFFLGSVCSRIFALTFLRWLTDSSGARQRVAIYGAGAAGIQLASALSQSRETQPILFVDDNPNLQGLLVAGLPVRTPALLEQLISQHRIERVLVAMPSISARRQRELISSLSKIGVEVQIMPSYIDMMAGNGLDTLRTVSPDELLGRNKVDLDTPEIAKTYAGRVVMVTGAGGSIGSELCRQLVNRNPARIVLFEQNEYALYAIDRDMRHETDKTGVAITARLGSVTNKARMRTIIEQEGVDIVLHAAAFKHVPLVEENELEGANNNVLGTHEAAEVAAEAGVERFILISTDKAVRPTSIMGATKRLAEHVVQDMQKRYPDTCFSMVRFGNVLGSSGSVLPLFQRQIDQGGPLTVTHPEVTRFFMTIPEAARLVLLASAYAKGSDVFVLDMGEPQKIIDIAHRMIELSGRKVKNSKTGVGDIAIEITGLRPGEKLYEELLIDHSKLCATPHPKILRAEEETLSQLEIDAMLRELRAALADGDSDRLRRLIAAKVEGFHVEKAAGSVSTSQKSA